MEHCIYLTMFAQPFLCITPVTIGRFTHVNNEGVRRDLSFFLAAAARHAIRYCKLFHWRTWCFRCHVCCSACTRRLNNGVVDSDRHSRVLRKDDKNTEPECLVVFFCTRQLGVWDSPAHSVSQLTPFSSRDWLLQAGIQFSSVRQLSFLEHRIAKPLYVQCLLTCYFCC